MTRPHGGRVRRTSLPAPLCIFVFVASVAFIAFLILGGAR